MRGGQAGAREAPAGRGCDSASQRVQRGSAHSPHSPGRPWPEGQPPGLCGRGAARGRPAHEGQTESQAREGTGLVAAAREVTLFPSPRVAVALSSAPGPRRAAYGSSARGGGERGSHRAAPRVRGEAGPGPWRGGRSLGHSRPRGGRSPKLWPGRCLDSCWAASSPGWMDSAPPPATTATSSPWAPDPRGKAPPPAPPLLLARPLLALGSGPDSATLSLSLWMWASLGWSPRAQGLSGSGRVKEGRGDAFHPRRAGWGQRPPCLRGAPREGQSYPGRSPPSSEG